MLVFEIHDEFVIRQCQNPAAAIDVGIKLLLRIMTLIIIIMIITITLIIIIRNSSTTPNN